MDLEVFPVIRNQSEENVQIHPTVHIFAIRLKINMPFFIEPFSSSFLSEYLFSSPFGNKFRKISGSLLKARVFNYIFVFDSSALYNI